MPRTTRSQAAAPLPSDPSQGIPMPVPSRDENFEQIPSAGATTEKKPRHRLTHSQLERLEALYKENTHPSRQVKQSLANEVGLPPKNITIWFQNKRQTARRQSTRSTALTRAEQGRVPGPSDAARSANILLGLTPEPASPRKDSSPSTTGPERLTKDRAATPQSVPAVGGVSYNAPVSRIRLGEARIRDLWSYLPSSPLTPTLVHSSVDSVSPSMLLPEDDVFGPVIASPDHNPRSIHEKKRPDLEWACAREEKRSRIRTNTGRPPAPDVFFGFEDVLDISSRDGERLGLVQVSNYQPEYYKSRPVSKAFCPDIPIPAEYHALFPTDVIEGASLLLGLKYTAVRM